MVRSSSVLHQPVDTFQTSRPFAPADYYLYNTVVSPSITATAAIGDVTLTLDDTTGILGGATAHVITIYENTWMFQTLVKSVDSATQITLAVPLDYPFTSSAIVETGLWSANVDGSSVDQKWSIKPPPNADIIIRSLTISMLDATDMGDGLFGGMPELTNGIRFEMVDGFTKNLSVVVNNLGLCEIGFTKIYSSKPPAGQYGVMFRRDVIGVNGVDLVLECLTSPEFRVWIRDDLQALDLFAITMHGYLKEIC